MSYVETLYKKNFGKDSKELGYLKKIIIIFFFNKMEIVNICLDIDDVKKNQFSFQNGLIGFKYFMEELS